MILVGESKVVICCILHSGYVDREDIISMLTQFYKMDEATQTLAGRAALEITF